jgi:hypothetical protein
MILVVMDVRLPCCNWNFSSCAAEMQGWREKRSMTFIHEEWICHFHDSKALHAGDVTRRRMECGILFHDRTLKIILPETRRLFFFFLPCFPCFSVDSNASCSVKVKGVIVNEG